VSADGFEHIGIGFGALGGEVMPGARADIEYLGAVRLGERR
jgi:hypothetical protein